MKKILSVLLCFLLIIPLAVQSFAAEGDAVTADLSAKSAVLMELSTGKILLSKNPDEKLPPASVTKIMTMLLVMEALDEGKITLEDNVTASRNASSKGGSQIWLKEGEQMTVHELLKATAVASANDACTALGEYVAGDESSFVARMNERAKNLGMNNTNFENCSGLDDTAENHYSSARDIAIMSRELMRHEKIKEYTTIWMDSLRGGKTELVNTNRLVRFYEGATGLKTGTTSKAGYCVSASAQRNGMELAAVVLGSDNSTERFEDAKKMLNWGFANYSVYQPSVDTSLITDVGVLYGEISTVTPVLTAVSPVLIKKGAEEKITQRVDMCIDVEAPVEKGQTLGTVFFETDGQQIASCRIVSENAVSRRSLFFVFCALWSSLGKK